MVKCVMCGDPNSLVPKPSNNLKASSDVVATETSTSYVKKKEITVPKYALKTTGFKDAGKLRISFDLQNNGATSAQARIYKNGVGVGTERSTTGTWVTYTEDLSFVKGDLIQLYAKRTGTAGQAEVRNFRIYCDGVCIVCGYDDSMLKKHSW